MNGITEWTIPIQHYTVKSLLWQGDTLVDWAGGGTRFQLDGTSTHDGLKMADRFDATVISPSGDFVVAYERLGTKGVIVHNRKLIREISRSHYHASVYEYPIALFKLPDGREVIAHCPEKYHQVHIDELATGKRLTESPARYFTDFFQSRFSVSEDNTHLLSAGWIWHPWDAVALYNITQSLVHPETLDAKDAFFDTRIEVNNAAFLDNQRLILTTSSEEPLAYEDEILPIQPMSLAIYDIVKRDFISSHALEEIIGTPMPINEDWVLGFYEYPKLISLKTGKVIYRWKHINSGKQFSSIIQNVSGFPPLAVDVKNHRFAVASETAVHVVQIDPTLLAKASPESSPPTPA